MSFFKSHLSLEEKITKEVTHWMGRLVEVNMSILAPKGVAEVQARSNYIRTAAAMRSAIDNEKISCIEVSTYHTLPIIRTTESDTYWLINKKFFVFSVQLQS